MRPELRRGWLVAAALVLLAAALLGALWLDAGVQATYLVDVVPGADAGLATSPALESARTRATVFGLLLLGLGLAAAGGALVLRHRRRR